LFAGLSAPAAGPFAPAAAAAAAASAMLKRTGLSCRRQDGGASCWRTRCQEQVRACRGDAGGARESSRSDLGGACLRLVDAASALSRVLSVRARSTQSPSSGRLFEVELEDGSLRWFHERDSELCEQVVAPLHCE
jgi:hypothetical protein